MSVEFIKMISEVQFERFNVSLLALSQTKAPCGIFFGFHFNAQAIVSNIQYLIQQGLNVTCVIVLVDAQAKLIKDLMNVSVVTLEDLPKLDNDLKPQNIFIFSGLKDFAFVPYFTAQGIDSFGQSDVNKFTFVMKHLPELYSVYNMLGSEESKKVYCAAIKGRLTAKIGDYRFAPEPQYFLNGFMPCEGDIAIDGGAYDGTTSLDFAKCGAKVYAFEMDAANYKNCRARLDASVSYDITLENIGLSDTESEESYSCFGVGSRKNVNGNLTARFTDLDTYAARNNISRVDYIKLDIEGAELEMLHGAAKTITRCKPKMAISAYHKPEDLWSLATYIKSLRADYEFEFRHYQIDCTDYMLDDEERAVLKYFGLSYLLPTSCELVLYCR